MPGGLNDGGAKLLQLPAPGATVRSPQRPHPQPGMSFHAIRTCKVDQGAGGKEPTCKSKSTSRGVNKKTSCSGPNVKPLLDNSRTVYNASHMCLELHRKFTDATAKQNPRATSPR